MGSGDRSDKRYVPLDEEVALFMAQAGLSTREAEVFRLLLSGVTTAERLGKLLSISPHTVNNHLTSIFDKTGTANKTETVATFVRHVLARLSHCRMFTQHPKVLVVDDEPEVGRVLGDYLAEKGVSVRVETDPVRALELVRELKLDFVISDIDMPEMDGLTLLKKIREVHRIQPMVILITGKPDYELDASLDLGAVAFIQKPVALGKLFFTLMENFIEGQHERSRLLRIDATLPVVLEHAHKATTANIGFGGAFLAFPRDGAAPVRRLAVGDRFSLDLKLEEGAPTYAVLAEVVWRRDDASLDLDAGVGAKFLEISPEGREALEEYVRLNKIASFIPLGAPTRRYRGGP